MKIRNNNSIPHYSPLKTELMTRINKTNRRDFLRQSAVAMALTIPVLNTKIVSAKPPKVVGLQLYTLRNLISKNPDEVLKKVAGIGYKEVETFGYSSGKYFGKTPKEFRNLLSGLGLTTPSGHYMPNNLKDNWESIVADAAELGQKYMACAYLFPNDRKTLDDWKKIAELFNKAGEVTKKSGIQFVYHNHDFEFQPIEGQLLYDLLLKETDPDLVKMELDLYWAYYAGKDPVDMFSKNPGRFPLMHFKDMAKTEKREFAEVGTGSIDFQKILKAGKVAGLKHFYVEQDECKIPPLEAIAISYRNVQKLRV